MPLAEPERPRKMLPPPMTRASSTPMSSNPPISLQMVPTVSGSIPVFCSPARASPLSLSSTRLYLSSAICSALVEAGHAGCCFHGSSDTEQQAFGRALFIIAKNVAISKHFYHAAPAGRHGTALCKAACTTGAGTPYGQGTPYGRGDMRSRPPPPSLPRRDVPAVSPAGRTCGKTPRVVPLRVAGHAFVAAPCIEPGW